MLEELYNKQIEKIFDYFDLESDPIFTPRFKKFIKFIAFKLCPFILSVASFLVFYFILRRIETSFGIERVLILVCVIVVFTLRKISNDIKKVVL